MEYQTINPFSEELFKTYPEHLEGHGNEKIRFRASKQVVNKP